MKTIFLTGLEACNLLGISHEILPYTTLNQKYSVDVPTGTGVPTLSYFGIGLKMKDLNRTPDTLSNLNPNKRSPLSTDVRFPVPFVIVPIDADLTLNERAEYRMRVVRIIDGITYAVYYLKKIDLSINGNYLNVYLNDDGTSDIRKLHTTMFTADDGIHTVNNHVINIDRKDEEFVAYSKSIKAELSPLDINNIVEAIRMLYPDNNLVDEKFIGELCIFSGIDVDVLNHTEAGSVQAGIFVEVNLELETLVTSGVTKIFEIGGMELVKGDGL
jgi:hypothetical protein